MAISVLKSKLKSPVASFDFVQSNALQPLSYQDAGGANELPLLTQTSSPDLYEQLLE